MINDKLSNFKPGRFDLIKYRFGRVKGVVFKRRELSRRTKWNALLAYEDTTSANSKKFLKKLN